VNHARQRRLDPLKVFLGRNAKPFVEATKKGKEALEKTQGYKFKNAHVAAVEICERLMRPGAWRELNITEAERDAYADLCVQSLEKAYGRQSATHITEQVRASQNDYPKDPEALEAFGQVVTGPRMEVGPATGKLRMARPPASQGQTSSTTTLNGNPPFSPPAKTKT